MAVPGCFWWIEAIGTSLQEYLRRTMQTYLERHIPALGSIFLRNRIQNYYNIRGGNGYLPYGLIDDTSSTQIRPTTIEPFFQMPDWTLPVIVPDEQSHYYAVAFGVAVITVGG
jgi:hypothetical protein